MSNILITGGAGFFGDLLKRALLERGHSCVSIDLEPDEFAHPMLRTIRGDIRDLPPLENLFREGRFDAVMHCAAILAHESPSREFLWTSNVDGTRNIAACAKRFRVPRVLFTSTNCLWGEGFDRLVRETDEPKPVEIYGRSKWESEKILLSHAQDFHAVIFRCPTIVDSGRLGLLAILYAFIDEGRRVWVIGGGENRYQFVYAQDLINACVRALTHDRTDIFNVGSDDVPTFREAYEEVIRRAKTGARVANFPRWVALTLMRVAHTLRCSPLGPYQYKMIAENFCFDTSKIKSQLGWRPTLTNADMLWKAYEYYRTHRDELATRTGVSAHRRPASMGIIRLLKAIS